MKFTRDHANYVLNNDEKNNNFNNMEDKLNASARVAAAFSKAQTPYAHIFFNTHFNTNILGATLCIV